MPFANVFGELRIGSVTMGIAARSAALTLALMPFAAAAATAPHDTLTIGVAQFPSTLNPNIDPAAAKSYVLGTSVRPLTAYDADWRAVCLLCTTLPSIANGLAKT